jgi:hypothetical protein
MVLQLSVRNLNQKEIGARLLHCDFKFESKNVLNKNNIFFRRYINIHYLITLWI